MVRPCAGSVEAYKAAAVKPEPPCCPRCGRPMVFWSSYERDVRVAFDPDSPDVRRTRIRILRVYCETCKTAPGFLPSFCLSRRLDVVEVIGRVIASVATGTPVAAVAEEQAIPRSTARAWISRFAERAPGIANRFAALAIDLGSGPIALPARPVGAAVEAIGRAWEGASRRLAGNVVGVWRFVSGVSGGALLATNRSPP